MPTAKTIKIDFLQNSLKRKFTFLTKEDYFPASNSFYFNQPSKLSKLNSVLHAISFFRTVGSILSNPSKRMARLRIDMNCFTVINQKLTHKIL